MILNTGVGSTQRFQHQLGDLLSSYMAAGDLLGRLHIMQVAKRKTGKDPTLSTAAAIAKFTEVMGFESVPPTDAIKYLSQLNAVAHQMYAGLKKRYQQQAFTVAHAVDQRMVQRIQDSLVEALQNGGTKDDFAKAYRDITSDTAVEEVTNLYVETVFRTNVQTAYMIGRFEQLRSPAMQTAFPYWEYVAVLDDRTRDEHAAMDGFQARADDSVWGVWYPPAGFNCRCSVIPVLDDEVDHSEADIPGMQRITDYPDDGFGGLGGLVA